ncbi:MAG: cell envelope integrity protein CreD [Paludibacter sp.]|nr:cell envelope integrity protein CreD [Paludibacter sp.]
MKTIDRISQSVTLKIMIIGVLILLLLIPGFMIQDLIRERQNRSEETIRKINSKWSDAQTLTGPVLVIPYKQTSVDKNNNVVEEEHELSITPENLYYKVGLQPEVKHLGIYKSILYKSEIDFNGTFSKPDVSKTESGLIEWKKAYFRIGVSDLRGISDRVNFVVGGQPFSAEAGGKRDVIGNSLIITPENEAFIHTDSLITFSCHLSLKGSQSLNFVPVGKTTRVEINGAWNAPGFTGNFSPDSKIDPKGFTAVWNVLHFNRNIPEEWIDSNVQDFNDTVFGVDLVDTVDHYQQNMRSAKYAVLFIALTFLVFFFVEIITKKRIHPIQYLLVGFALLLFYTLLLSVSEQLGFGWAYIIASVATIGLITSYAHGIFKNRMQTSVMAAFLSVLYVFLYVILQLEDIALLIGSIGLFVILGVIMFVSRKINWYHQGEESSEEERNPEE